MCSSFRVPAGVLGVAPQRPRHPSPMLKTIEPEIGGRSLCTSTELQATPPRQRGERNEKIYGL